tara:strand:- start:576 stop:773 length:198 start_codon:yes stop_codon:yes gene_type:complete
MEEQKFTIEEIRNYIMSQDSLGDVMYNLKAEKIIEANEPEEDEFGECDATEADIVLDILKGWIRR